jgi:hypothetical protein
MKEMFPERITSRQSYYDELDRMHEWLAARLPKSETFHGEQSVATA